MKYLDEQKPGLKKRCPLGHFVQFTALFFVLALAGIGSSYAGEVPLFHGVGIAKQCVQNKRTCTDDASCTDGNVCTPDTCNTAIGNTTDCIIQITYADEAGDTISVKGSFDTVDYDGDAVRVPAAGNLPISFVSGTTTCVVGAFAPCTIGPGAAQVRFRSNTYVVQADDPDPLPDRGTVIVADLCNALPADPGCNGSDNPVPFTAQTNLVTGCSSGAPDDCDDDNACTTDSCDPQDGCQHSAPPSCDDEDACTADSCNAATGLCEHGAPPGCDDEDACTADSCNPATGLCEHGAPPGCDDEDACTADSCNPATGLCEHGAPPGCDDEDACTADSCNPATGLCEHGAPPGCDDEDACTADSCNPATGLCEHGAPPGCDDEDACTADSCNPATGLCEHGTPPSCDDEDACTADSCNAATGLCEHGAPPSCDDQDECTNDSCDPLTGDCVNEDNGTCVGEDICRTPGFWKEHAGTEKKTSHNITQAVIDSTDDDRLYVCGTYLNNTNAGNNHSVLEAMCVSGGGRTQLVRQLTATALNCAMTSSGGGGACEGVDSIADIYAECDDACRTQDSAAYGACIEALDHWNNGITGNQCHDRDLCPDFSDDGELNDSALCFEPTGAAGSQDECKKAQKNNVSVP